MAGLNLSRLPTTAGSDMDWYNAALFLLFVAGHTELQVALLNRLYAVPLRCGTLRHCRHLHDVLVPLFPVLLVWFAGVRGPKLLLGGSWDDVSAGWWCLFALCLVGAVGLCVSTCRWQLRNRSAGRPAATSTVIDIADRLEERPLGEGPHRFLLHVPGNEVFQVEFAEKMVRHPRWPPEWDGLRILHLSDLHFTGTIDRPFFTELIAVAIEQRPHLIAFTGDLLDRQALTDWLPETLGRLHAPLGCYFILGNHDWYLQPDESRRALRELGWTDVSAAAGKIPGERIQAVLEQPANGPDVEDSLFIGGDERPWMGTAADFSGTDAAAFRLLLSHTPDNLPWAKSNDVDLMLAGHNHGGQVVLPVIGPVYSPSRFGVKYSGGLFWEPPTLLHVSRGVSGKHPLRWWCRPEVTTLVLCR